MNLACPCDLIFRSYYKLIQKGYLYAVWQAFIKQSAEETISMTNQPIAIKNFKILNAVLLDDTQKATTLNISILGSTGMFEIKYKDQLIATGEISKIKAAQFNQSYAIASTANTDDSNTESNNCFDTHAIYTEFRLRGYEYFGEFAKMDLHDGKSKCTIPFGDFEGSFIPFMDMMLQSHLFTTEKRSFMLPTRIREILIDPSQILSKVEQGAGATNLPCRINTYTNTSYAPGVIISGLHCTITARRAVNDNPTYQTYQFLPNSLQEAIKYSLEDCCELCFDWLVSRKPSKNSYLISIVADDHQNASTNTIKTTFENLLTLMPMCDIKISMIDANSLNISNISKDDLVIFENLPKNSDEIAASVKDDCFIATLDSSLTEILGQSENIKQSMSMNLDQGLPESDTFTLFYKHKPINSEVNIVNVKIESHGNFDWVDQIKDALKNTDPSYFHLLTINLSSAHRSIHGFTGFFKCLVREPEYSDLNFCAIVRHDVSESESSTESFPNDFLKAAQTKMSPLFIEKNGQIGTMRHISKELWGKVKTEKAFINAEKLGDMSTIDWYQSKLDFEPTVQSSSDQKMVLCKVAYAPLNFRDIMVVSGRLPPDALPVNLEKAETLLGLEFSGYATEKSCDGSEVLNRYMGFMSFEVFF